MGKYSDAIELIRKDPSLSYVQVAKEINSTPGSVRVYVCRARKQGLIDLPLRRKKRVEKPKPKPVKGPEQVEEVYAAFVTPADRKGPITVGEVIRRMVSRGPPLRLGALAGTLHQEWDTWHEPTSNGMYIHRRRIR